MKKILLIIFLFLISMMQVNASVTEQPVVITLKDNFYSTITRTYQNGLTTINYTNKLPTMTLTDAQLRSILDQSPNASRLTYYETLNIKVKPVEGTNYASLKNKTKYYRANDGGSWINANLDNYTSEKDDVAVIKNLDSDFWPWGFKLQYRLTEDGTWTSSIPVGKNLDNKTLEEQIATIFDIDLDTNPDGVIDLYPNRLRFNPLPEGYNHRLRIDFYDTKDGVTPTLANNSTDEYDVDTLKHLGTEYVIIKYNRTNEEAQTINIEETKAKYKEGKTKKTLGYIISTIGILGASYYIYLKKRR